jgi:hypothetical protein
MRIEHESELQEVHSWQSYNLEKSWMSSCDILRNYQLSYFLKILQILNGYMQLIASSVLVSNYGPEKWGLEAIKRANP